MILQYFFLYTSIPFLVIWTQHGIGEVKPEGHLKLHDNKVTTYLEQYSDKIQRRQRHPTPVLLPGKSHGWRSPVGCSLWGHYESDRTERLHFHFSLSCIGEGNGNPLQYSCLENPRDGGSLVGCHLWARRVGHNWSDLAAAASNKIYLNTSFPLQCFSESSKIIIYLFIFGVLFLDNINGDFN